MKQKIVLFLSAMLLCLSFLQAQRSRVTLTTVVRDAGKAQPQRLMDASKLKFDQLELAPKAPKNVTIYMEPKEGDYLVYHITPGFDFYSKQLGQLSVVACVGNSGSSQVDLDKVVIEYKKGAQTISKSITLPSDQLKVDPGYTWCWQNSRDYHVPGDVVFMEAPFPTEASFKFYFKNFADPIVVKKALKPYDVALDLPFLKKDLRKDEYWSGYSMHGGGDQVFAYDLGVTGYDNGWNDILPGKDDSKNENFRIWGKPVYAMADGQVLEFLNECPNNGGPIHAKDDADYDKKMAEQKDKYWGPYEKQGGGAGNHLIIHHGSVVALYAHMQKGSIPAKFLSKLVNVKKGDFLGYAGNAGNSSGPHLHIHVDHYKDNNTPGGEWFRPLLFANGFVIGQSNYPKPMSNVAWSALDKEGIPGLQGKASFIWPGDTHPYCAYPTNWGEVTRAGISSNDFQGEFDKMWTCGYYPIWIDGYDAGGKTYFNVITRPSKGVQWVARHNMDGNGYQTEYNKWDKAGYRLLHVDSYLRGNTVNYTAVWVKDGKPQPLAYHGKPLAQHEAEFKGNSDKGWVPVHVSCVVVGGTTYVTATWEKKNTGGFYARPAMTLQQYKDYFKDYSDNQKFKLVSLDGYTKNGVPMLSGVWYKDAPNYNTWWAKHHLNGAELQTEYNSELANGFMTRCITGYSDGGVQRFEGIWSK